MVSRVTVRFHVTDYHVETPAQEPTMQEPLLEECAKAFEHGDMQDAQRLIAKIGVRSAGIRLELTVGEPGGLVEVSLLHLAVRNGWPVPFVSDLITIYKCDERCKDSKGATPLFYAVRYDHPGLVEYFTRDRNPRAAMVRDSSSNTPLHYACSLGYLNITRYYVNHLLCDVLCKDGNGNTPLHLAYFHNHTFLAKWLLETRKVNPLAKNKYGKTPLE